MIADMQTFWYAEIHFLFRLETNYAHLRDLILQVNTVPYHRLISGA